MRDPSLLSQTTSTNILPETRMCRTDCDSQIRIFSNGVLNVPGRDGTSRGSGRLPDGWRRARRSRWARGSLLRAMLEWRERKPWSDQWLCPSCLPAASSRVRRCYRERRAAAAAASCPSTVSLCPARQWSHCPSSGRCSCVRCPGVQSEQMTFSQSVSHTHTHTHSRTLAHTRTLSCAALLFLCFLSVKRIFLLSWHFFHLSFVFFKMTHVNGRFHLLDILLWHDIEWSQMTSAHKQVDSFCFSSHI